jgi:hypothetical protein
LADKGEASKEETSHFIKRGDPIRKFLQAIGYDAPFESSSKLLVEPYDRRAPYTSSSPAFVGDISNAFSETVPEKYKRYCTPSSSLYTSPFSTNEQARSEFEAGLQDFSLQSDDVAGI